MKSDSYPWVQFSFYPCPVGADVPSQCSQGLPFPMDPQCCVNDKFEACLQTKLQCFENSTSCDFDTRRKLANFLSCFEGQTIDEGHCPGKADECMKKADLYDKYYTAVNACFNNPIAVKSASRAMNESCTVAQVQWWPYVHVNGKLLCSDDSCMMPLLPVLCKAYQGSPKPASCQQLA